MKSKFYAVHNGRKLGIFLSWDECQEQVHHFKGAGFKSFSTRAEAENYLRDHSVITDGQTFKKPNLSTPIDRGSYQSRIIYDSDSEDEQPAQPIQSKKLSSQPSPETLFAPLNSRPSSYKVPVDPCPGVDKSELVVAYVAGVCVELGRDSARAGYGIFYDDNDLRNISTLLEGEAPTHMRAELRAIVDVLHNIDCPRPNLTVQIHTNTTYAATAATSLAALSVRGGKPYKNKDLLLLIYSITRDLKDSGVKILITFTPGAPIGKEQAKYLARLALLN